MSDDDFIDEYCDYSKLITLNSTLEVKDKTLLNELNSLRYKFDNNYISVKKYYKQIACQAFVGFLTSFEEDVIKRQRDLHSKLSENRKVKVQAVCKLF